MRLILIPCDAGTVTEGKLNLLGAYWTRVLVPNKPFTAAIGVVLMLTAEEAVSVNVVRFQVGLLDSRNRVVSLKESGRGKAKRVEVIGTLDPGQALRDGVTGDLQASLVVSFRMTLSPGQYKWRLKAGDQEDEWPFQVVPPDAPSAH